MLHVLHHAKPCCFPDIVDGEEGWRERVAERFENKQFPQDSYACSSVVSKCWNQEYETAEDVVKELRMVEAAFGEE